MLRYLPTQNKDKLRTCLSLNAENGGWVQCSGKTGTTSKLFENQINRDNNIPLRKREIIGVR